MKEKRKRKVFEIPKLSDTPASIISIGGSVGNVVLGVIYGKVALMRKADKKRRLGADALEPKRLKHKKFVR